MGRKGVGSGQDFEKEREMECRVSHLRLGLLHDLAHDEVAPDGVLLAAQGVLDRALDSLQAEVDVLCRHAGKERSEHAHAHAHTNST